jgi:hypothetical protein
MSDAKHIGAIITLAERELSEGDWTHRAGVMSALLQESLPYLRRQLVREQELDVLRRELAIVESNASERSDPASNAENDEEIRRLRTLIESHEVTA